MRGYPAPGVPVDIGPPPPLGFPRGCKSQCDVGSAAAPPPPLRVHRRG